MTEASIFAFLRAIEQGEITLMPEIPPHEVYAGVVPYVASNGWRIAIFNDADEWDYIEWVEAAGERITYEEMDAVMPALARYEPDLETSERAYGIPWRMSESTRLAEAARLRAADEAAFDDVQRIFGGTPPPALGADSSKLFRSVMTSGDHDWTLTREALMVRIHSGKQFGGAHRDLVPAVVGELLARAGLREVSKPTLLGLPAAEVPPYGRFTSWSYPAKLVALVPGEDAVMIWIRSSPENWVVPYVGDLPTDGPMAVRELPKWVLRPAEKTMVTFAEPLPCPHCAVASTSYRDLGNALVCGGCGRSFERCFVAPARA